MARLSRAESQAQTRQQLMATAKQLFLELGYHATSLEKVADRAGFSKGAVYSNFRNKDELCVAVLEETRAERVAEILAILTEPDPDARLARFQSWAEAVIGDPAWTSLEVEFAMHARRNEPQRTELSARLDSILGMLSGAAQADDLDGPLPPDELAVTVLALGVGLGIFRAVNPAIPVTGLVDALRYLGGVPATQPSA
ncbi:TetR/AcrR family transcriptional regulator [Nocardia thailandica]|uniref:TetR/AcrR family transcriptional regulator n=1 Tax=Nocardia thailandica TaxID=257275 RepID=A0ABW6PI16_9NOCA